MIDAKTLIQARKLVDQGEVDHAWKIAKTALFEDPNSIAALGVAAAVQERAGNLGVAYQFYKRISELEPRESASWVNFGKVAEDLWRSTEAERAYGKGLEVATREASKVMLFGNMSALMIDNGRYKEAEKWARRALALDPESAPVKMNLGFCQLAQHEWAEGWKNYHHTIGTDWRPRKQYKDEPEWDGSPDKNLVLYGDQGIGDEICFASMVKDVQKVSKKLILDIDARLTALFKRSFPGVRIYGTRLTKEGDGVKWAKEDRDIECSLPLGQAGEYMRLKPEDFPSEPYLKADPERVLMWKSLWAVKGKPVIGIAWSGGIPKTGMKFRTLGLEKLLPLFNAVDAHWVSLQYKPASAEIAEFTLFNQLVDIKEYPYATLTKDYDDTAALVASLDLVISVPTAAAHLAGALGTPCIAMKSPKSCWKFYKGLAWHPGVRLVENSGEWDKTIADTAELACDVLHVEQKAVPENVLARVFTIKGNGACA